MSEKDQDPASRSEAPWENEREMRFFAALGWAIANWSRVEREASVFYGYLIHHRQFGSFGPMVAETSFNAIGNFRSRIQVLEAAAKMSLTQDDFAAWAKIQKKISQASSEKRNKMAHCPLEAIGEAGGYRYVLHDYSASAYKRRKYLYDENDFTAWGYEFRELATELSHFRPTQFLSLPQAFPL